MSVVNFDGGGWWSKPSCVPPWALRGRVGCVPGLASPWPPCAERRGEIPRCARNDMNTFGMTRIRSE